MIGLLKSILTVFLLSSTLAAEGFQSQTSFDSGQKEPLKIYRNKFAKTTWADKSDLDTSYQLLIEDSLFRDDAMFEKRLFLQRYGQQIQFRNTTFSKGLVISNFYFDNEELPLRAPLHLEIKDDSVNLEMILDGITSKYVLVESNTVLGEAQVDFSRIGHLHLIDNDLSTLSFKYDTLSELLLRQNTIGEIIFRNSIIEEGRYYFDQLPQSIAFYDSKIDVLDFGHSGYVGGDSREKCRLRITNTVIDRIRIDYSHFRIDFDSDVSRDPIEFQLAKNQYMMLFDLFRKQMDFENYELLDKEFLEFKYLYTPANVNFLVKVKNRLFNFLDKHWWDYGYNKSLIFRNAIIIMLFFSVLNIFFFSKLNEKIYTFDSLNRPEYYQVSKWRMVTHAFMYTGLLLFSLQVSVDKVNFQKPAWAIYVIGQYLIGIICIGYLANFVITEGNVGL